MSSDDAIASLRRAVAALPDDLELRLHLAELELADGQRDAAIATISQALALAPDNTRVREFLARALTTPSIPPASPTPTPASLPLPPDPVETVDTYDANAPDANDFDDDFDWDAAEDDLGTPTQPMFVDTDGTDAHQVFSVERPNITLADVGGMDNVKKRLTVSFLGPLQNPGLRQLYGKSLRGGLLMYGPPGCGKTYIARAVAGELKAAFLPIGVADVLDKWMGASERNIHELFMQARRDSPCVVFLDELDTLGQRRSTSNSTMVSVTNQLLTELDGFAEDNEGVFVLAATNQPWQVDPALRRPGRFDRTILVLPPDTPAREAIFKHYLAMRPVEGINLGRLAARTDGYTGADIAYVCESAAERALMDSVESGEPRMITMADVEASLADIRPSIGQWLETARNVVMFGEDDGTFADLRTYLKKAKRL